MKQAQVMPVMDSSAAARISKPTNGRQTEGERERVAVRVMGLLKEAMKESTTTTTSTSTVC